MQYVDEKPGIAQERQLGELVSDLTRETATLVRQEVALAKTEVVTKAKDAAGKSTFIVGGAVLGLTAALALAASLILVLALWLAAWAAALIVGLALGLAGAGLVRAGAQALKRVDLVPRETARTMNENKLWLKEQVSQ